MRIAVVGAGGFVGSAVLRAAAGRQDLSVVATYRHSPLIAPAGITSHHRVDLENRQALRLALDSVEAVLCCVSYVGKDASSCAAVNIDGIQSLAKVALVEARIPRVLHMSTTAIYGTGPHRGLTTQRAQIHPESEASRTRAVGDELIRSLGGSVLRPHLVFGPGDRWCAPTIATITETLGAYIDHGSARLSTIQVDALATQALDLVTAQSWTGGAASHPHMSTHTVAEIIGALESAGSLVTPTASIPHLTARKMARSRGLRERHIDMLGLDHWYA